MTFLVTEEELDAQYPESTAGGIGLEPPVDQAVIDDDDLEPDDLEAQPSDWIAPPLLSARENPSPWERQRGEPVRAYHAFCHFRDQKVHSCAVGLPDAQAGVRARPGAGRHGRASALAALEFGVGLGGARGALGR